MSKTYTLHIEAYSPETIPMARLALYMQSYAAILGHEASVHFDRLEPGSTRLVTRVDFEDVPKVRARLDQVKRGDATGDLAKAEEELDRLLFDDNATGEILENENGTGGQVIAFPGINRPRPVQYGPFNQEGSLDGVLVSVGGIDRTKHIQLQNGDLKYTGITTDQAKAREIAKHLFEPIRIFGTGRWMREEDGTWTLKSFKLESFCALRADDLTDAVDQLRAIEGNEWKTMDDPLEALRALRADADELH